MKALQQQAQQGRLPEGGGARDGSSASTVVAAGQPAPSTSMVFGSDGWLSGRSCGSGPSRSAAGSACGPPRSRVPICCNACCPCSPAPASSAACKFKCGNRAQPWPLWPLSIVATVKQGVDGCTLEVDAKRGTGRSLPNGLELIAAQSASCSRRRDSEERKQHPCYCYPPWRVAAPGNHEPS